MFGMFTFWNQASSHAGSQHFLIFPDTTWSGSNAKLLLRLANASVPVSLGEVPSEGDPSEGVAGLAGLWLADLLRVFSEM